VTIGSGVFGWLRVKVCPFPYTLKVVLTTLALSCEVCCITMARPNGILRLKYRQGHLESFGGHRFMTHTRTDYEINQYSIYASFFVLFNQLLIDNQNAVQSVIILYRSHVQLFFFESVSTLQQNETRLVHSQAATIRGKKSELMLMRCTRAYSSFCSQVILVYLHPFRRNSLFSSQKSPKIT